MNAVGRDRVADDIRDPGGQSLDQSVVAVPPPSANQIIPRGKREELENVRRIELQITVQGCDQLSSSMTKAGVERRGLSAIMIEVDHAHFGMVAGKLVEEAAAAVGAPIIDVDDFK